MDCRLPGYLRFERSYTNHLAIVVRKFTTLIFPESERTIRINIFELEPQKKKIRKKNEKSNQKTRRSKKRNKPRERERETDGDREKWREKNESGLNLRKTPKSSK